MKTNTLTPVLMLSLLAVTFLGNAGCRSRSMATVGKTAAVETEELDDEQTIKAIETTGAKTKFDDTGFVIEIDYRGTEIDDKQLVDINGLKKLRSLLLAETAVTDEGMGALTAFPTLQNLDLRGCSISNAALEPLSKLKNLKALRLSGKNGQTTIDEDGMAAIGKMTNLKVLALDFLWVGGEEGLEKLSSLKKLEELYLAKTLIGDEGIAKFQAFPKLRKLRISQTQIGAAGVEQLPKLESLEEVDLSENSQLFDDGIVHLASMTKLKRLNLWRVAITDAGVESLAGLVNLEWLNLDNTQMSDAGLPQLSKMTKLKFLHLGSTAVSDAGLSHLESLKALKDLKVTRTAVTEKGVEQLKAKLPDAEIQLKYIEGE